MAILRLLATLTFGITVSTTVMFTAGPPTQSNSTLVANPNSATDIVMTAVQQDGMALFLAADGLKADRDIAIAAVKQNRNAFQWAD